MCKDPEKLLTEALEKAREVLQDAINELLDDDWDTLAEDVNMVIDRIGNILLDGDVMAWGDID